MNNISQIHRLFNNTQSLIKLSLLINCLCLFMPVSGQLVRSAAGPDAASITPIRDAFRADLGGGNVAGANGSFGGVRREINWDGVPDALSAPNLLPANFFNVNSPRGVIFSTPGPGFQVSANAGVGPVDFGNINPSYPTIFAPFSPQRLFTAVASNITDISFFVPGTSTPALTRGFGAIFSDVDLPNVSSIQFFGLNNISLGTFFVPGIPGNETFSFLGLSFPVPMITRVRITLGNAPLAGQNESLPIADLVTMDDFLYGEPLPIVIPQSNLAVTKTAPATVAPQGTITYSISVTNNGPDAAQNVVLTDVLPAGLNFVSFTAPAGWTSTTPAVGNTGTITATNPSLANAASAVFTLVAQVSGPGSGTTFTNTATISSATADPNTANNSASASTTVSCPTITVSIPDAYSLPSGVTANTVYVGYAPASSITLNSSASGGTGPYTYTWSTGSHAASITVSPVVTTTYTVTVTDANGCAGSASKTINVIDIRGGRNLDKVVICHKPDKQENTLVIDADDVANHLGHGDLLGECPSPGPAISSKASDINKDAREISSALNLFPNPSSGSFTINIPGRNDKPIQMVVTDMNGRLIERLANLQPNQRIRFGHNYKPGMYMLEIMQGTFSTKQKIIKTQ